MTASRVTARPATAPRFHIDSPRPLISWISTTLLTAGSVTGLPAGEPPAIRIRINQRMVYCLTETVRDPAASPGTISCRFEARFSTRRGFKLLRFEIQNASGNWHAFARRFVYVRTRPDSISYPKWLRKNARRRPPLPAPVKGPLISVLVPVYNPEPRWLQAMIESVRKQTYPHWELCLADDASTHPEIPRLLTDAASGDTRIKWVRRPENGHISAATNSALALATGDYVAFLDQNDLLAPEALAEIARAVLKYPHARIFYSDEDKIDVSDRRYGPHFKSSWNPDLLLGQNYFCHLTAYQTALVRQLGGLRTGLEGAQDWDLALRAVTAVPADAIVHIPRILYHWRAVKGSTALANTAKTSHTAAALRSLRNHLDRNHIDGEILLVSEAHWRIRLNLPNPPPKVTLIIPTRNRVDLLRTCVESVLRVTRYPDYELLIVDNGSDEPAAIAYLRELSSTGRARVLRDDGPFNYSTLNNRAARIANGSVLALLNNDIEPINADWLEEMVALALRPSTGAVGALLLFPDDRIQHAGVVLGLTGDPDLPGVAGHAFLRQNAGDPGYMNRLGLLQNYSAVTAACLVVRREVFLQVDGLNEQDLPVNYNDVDFCLRLREAGYWNTWTPHARLYHHESASRGADDTPEKSRRAAAEIAYMHRRWGEVLANDPAYNPFLSLMHQDFRLAYPFRSPRDARINSIRRPPS